MVDTLVQTDSPMMESGRRALLQGWTAGARDLMLTRANGSLVWDSEGREYIDCTAQAWSNNVGANHPRVIAAAQEQIGVLTHARNNFETQVLLELAHRMIEIAPPGIDRVGFCPNGSLAGEMAIKLALRNSDHPGPFLTFFDGYHGRSLATMAASWPHPNPDFLRMFPPFVRVPNPRTYRPGLGRTVEEDAERCADILRQTIQHGTQGKPPALMMEPVLGNGGQQDYPPEFYQRVRQICDEEDVLLIVDEVQTGAGGAAPCGPPSTTTCVPTSSSGARALAAASRWPACCCARASSDSRPATTRSPSGTFRWLWLLASPPSMCSSRRI
jgi:4-aminobutyrate aminotransferase/4-aminobutyrate aminotransferase/(S)-3-amino-2-methylpropionate transaminase